MQIGIYNIHSVVLTNFILYCANLDNNWIVKYTFLMLLKSNYEAACGP